MQKATVASIAITIGSLWPVAVAWAAPAQGTATQDFVVVGPEYIALERAAERLLVTLAGILALWMGYRLFRVFSENRSPAEVVRAVAGATSTAAGAAGIDPGVAGPRGGFEGSIGELVKVKLWDVGPGLFFAMFGCGLLAYVMFSDIKIITATNDSGKTVTISYGFPGLSAEESKDKAARMLRSIRKLRDFQLKEDPDTEEKDKADSAIETLYQEIPLLVDAGFGDGWYALYEKLRVNSEEREKATPEQLKTFSDINALLNGV